MSVWISRGCLGPSGHIEFCENSPGLVLTSTAYWPNPGAAAIPADLFLLGTRTGAAGRDAAAWTSTLGNVYPEVQPKVGAKYLGRAWLRSLRVVRFATSADEDRRVLSEIDAAQRNYHYSYSVRNCAFYAETILQRYLGPSFHGSRVLEFGIQTPRAVERALQHRLNHDGTVYRIVRFRGDFRHSWRQPSRNICESAIFDPKYAIPLLMYQPLLYVGFAGCYGAVRLFTWAPHLQAPTPMMLTAAPGKEQRLHAFELLTGVSTEGFGASEAPRSAMLPPLDPPSAATDASPEGAPSAR